MSWEAWGDPPDPPEMRPCLDCRGLGYCDGEKCETCKGEGIHFEYDVL
jgi:DnaJ-class molecular chaperone